MATLNRVVTIPMHVIGYGIGSIITVKNDMTNGKWPRRCHICRDNHVTCVGEICRAIRTGMNLGAPGMTAFVKDNPACLNRNETLGVYSCYGEEVITKGKSCHVPREIPCCCASCYFGDVIHRDLHMVHTEII